MEEQFSPFVSIQLSKEHPEALYVQLYRQICSLISRGELSHGFLLPSVRKFAKRLGVNPGTVVSAYRLLEKNGYIFSRGGSGSYVAQVPVEMDDGESAEARTGEPDEAIYAPPPSEDGLINLAGIALNPEWISVEKFKQVINEVLDRDKGYAFGYQESQGFYPLRESIAANLGAHGVKADAGNVQIISGAQQGIDIAAKALLNYGDYVFTETPTYPGAIAAFRSRGAKIVEIPMLADGICLERLEENLRTFRPKLIYVMPNIQNPTGCSYSLQKRARLMGLARYYQAIILEDDYISELSYEKEQMAPLKAIDRDDRVIYLKSFSKIFMPGLRLAFLTIPSPLIGRLLSVKHNSDISTSGLTQRAFDLYLRKGVWHVHIDEIKRLYTAQFNVTLRAIEKHLPACVRYIKPLGGLSVWLTLPESIPASRVVREALGSKVLIAEGSAFFPRRAEDRYLRISFAAAGAADIAAGIRRVGEIVAALENSRR